MYKNPPDISTNLPEKPFSYNISLPRTWITKYWIEGQWGLVFYLKTLLLKWFSSPPGGQASQFKRKRVFLQVPIGWALGTLVDGGRQHLLHGPP